MARRKAKVRTEKAKPRRQWLGVRKLDVERMIFDECVLEDRQLREVLLAGGAEKIFEEYGDATEKKAWKAVSADLELSDDETKLKLRRALALVVMYQSVFDRVTGYPQLIKLLRRFLRSKSRRRETNRKVASLPRKIDDTAWKPMHKLFRDLTKSGKSALEASETVARRLSGKVKNAAGDKVSFGERFVYLRVRKAKQK